MPPGASNPLLGPRRRRSHETASSPPAGGRGWPRGEGGSPGVEGSPVSSAMTGDCGSLSPRTGPGKRAAQIRAGVEVDAMERVEAVPVRVAVVERRAEAAIVPGKAAL